MAQWAFCKLDGPVGLLSAVLGQRERTCTGTAPYARWLSGPSVSSVGPETNYAGTAPLARWASGHFVSSVLPEFVCLKDKFSLVHCSGTSVAD